MKRVLFVYLLLTSFVSVHAQENTENQIKTVINRMVDGMRQGDSSMVASVLGKDIILQTVSARNGEVSVQTGDVPSFLKSIAAPHLEPFDERLVYDRISIDGNLASVWTNYPFISVPDSAIAV